jgi:alpha-L-arabinofuranosidase
MPALGQVPYLDVVGTFDPVTKTAVLLVLNRDLEKPRELQIDWHEVTPTKVNSCEVLTGPDLKAVNTFNDPKKVLPPATRSPEGGLANDSSTSGAFVYRSFASDLA